VYDLHQPIPGQLFDDKQTTLKTEEESVKYINHVSCKSHTSNNYGNTAMNAGECNGLIILYTDSKSISTLYNIAFFFWQ
jgi:hypothetical protein